MSTEHVLIDFSVVTLSTSCTETIIINKATRNDLESSPCISKRGRGSEQPLETHAVYYRFLFNLFPSLKGLH